MTRGRTPDDPIRYPIVVDPAQDLPPKSPRTIIESLDIGALVAAVAGAAARWDPVVDGPAFPCPRCGAAAFVECEATWRCEGCGHHGTRIELERIVLEDADRLRWFLGQVHPESWAAFTRGEVR